MLLFTYFTKIKFIHEIVGARGELLHFLGPLLFIIFTSDSMIAYADDFTLYATIKSSSDCLAVAESLNLDLKKTESWCMCLSLRKSSVVISRSRTINLPHPHLITNGHSLAMDGSFKLLGVLFDKNLHLSNTCDLQPLALLKRWKF